LTTVPGGQIIPFVKSITYLFVAMSADPHRGLQGPAAAVDGTVEAVAAAVGAAA
jgi:hypothetical protein